MESQETNYFKSSSGFTDIQPSLYEELDVGPGQYPLKSFIPSGPSYSFSKSGRFSTPPSKDQSYLSMETPAKTLNPLEKSKKVGSMSPKLMRSADHSPGPGNYEMTSTLFNKRISIGGKYKDLQESKTPGPGHYDTSMRSSGGFPNFTDKRMKGEVSVTSNVDFYYNSFISSGPRYSMGLKPRSASTPAIPGPGSYDLPSVQLSKNFTIMPKRDPIPNLKTPGPGTYNNELTSSSQKFSIGLPLSPKSPDQIPGPGEYDLDSKPSGPRYSIRSRFTNKELEDSRDFATVRSSMTAQAPLLRGKPKDPSPSKVPGPGEYDVSKSFDRGGFSQSKSGRFSDVELSPGPGDYLNERKSDAPKYTFSASQRFIKNKSSSPGPGAYDEKDMNRSILVTLRGKPKEAPDAKIPGPGSYNLEEKRRSTAYSFGIKFEQNFDNGKPGPGAYPVTNRSSSPSWTIAERRELKKSESVPGPGSYDAKLNNSVVTYSFNKKKEEKIDLTPGPGDYDSQIPKVTGISFGQKFPERIEDSPGPGEYEPKLRTSSPSWTIPGRRSLGKKSETPGPCQYELSKTSSCKGISFSKLERKFSPSKTPAPTDYNLNSSSLNDSVKYSVGKSSRIDFTKLKVKTPGPGSYNNASKSKSVLGKFSSAKRETKFLINHAAPFIKCDLKPSGPFYSISGKTSERKTNTTPGPGAYQKDLQFKPSSPAFSMGTRRSLQKKIKSFQNYTPVRGRK